MAGDLEARQLAVSYNPRIANASTETWNPPQNRFCHIISPIDEATSSCAIYIALSAGNTHRARGLKNGAFWTHTGTSPALRSARQYKSRYGQLWTTCRAAREGKAHKLYATHGALVF